MATAWAQTPEGAGGPPQIYNIGFLVVLVGIFYFLLLRPEQKRRKEHTELLAGLKRNDQVVLSSGIHGRVVALGEPNHPNRPAGRPRLRRGQDAVHVLLGRRRAVRQQLVKVALRAGQRRLGR